MTILTGDCLEVMRAIPDNHFTGVVTDPPYGLGFMGKKWDAGLPHDDIWKEALRISKPGAYLLAFGGTRTYHRLTCAIEDAGWEIRDCIMWVYGSGFPKSKGCLKPAYEPIVLARKIGPNPRLNIDASRIGTDDTRATASKNAPGLINDDGWECKERIVGSSCGRWPANIIFDENSSSLLGQAHRFFYCAKASSHERNEGLDLLEKKKSSKIGDGMRSNIGNGNPGKTSSEDRKQKNHHPTVKPLSLMRYLITLVQPTENHLILDPFCGSGTTIMAAKQLGIEAIGIEKEPEYAEIARARVLHASKEPVGNLQTNLFA